jgi:hypothetical protein
MHLPQGWLRTTADAGHSTRNDSNGMPTTTFLGQAGLAIDARGFRLLADPWFARTGAFLGAWHQFPRNDHLDTPELLDVDWVAVSHEHLDHMDLSTLRRLPARTRVLIPHYPSPAFRDRLAAGGPYNFAFGLATRRCVNARCEPMTTRLVAPVDR